MPAVRGDSELLTRCRVMVEDRQPRRLQVGDEVWFFILAAPKQPQDATAELLSLSPAELIPKLSRARLTNLTRAEVLPRRFVMRPLNRRVNRVGGVGHGGHFCHGAAAATCCASPGFAAAAGAG